MTKAPKQSDALHGALARQDKLALDFASVRSRDANGYLHIAVSNISKAAVNGYLGSEIPDYEGLGLNPLRMYQLLRDPEEMQKSAPTFNGMPLMMVHKPQASASFSREVVVGSLGTDAEFKAPFLRNSMVIWDGAAIAGIETREQQEISCGYRYDADMTPGEFEGVAYDGVMRNLRANHVALVPDGRAGADCVVGDSKPSFLITQEISPMAQVTLSRKAALAKGALSVYLAPKLAQDAKINFGDILKDVTAKNFGVLKPKLADRIKAATKEKMAQDATLDDLNLLLDKLDDSDGMEDPSVAVVGDEDEETDGTVTVDADDDLKAKAKELLKAGLSPEEHAKLCEMIDGGAGMAGDEPPPTPGTNKTGGEPVTKQAMDAAIEASVAAASKATEAATIARLKAVRDAENVVRPYIGEIAIAQDSAEGVYRLALDALGVPNADIREVPALRAVLNAQPKPGARPRATAMATDSSAVDFR